MYTVHAQRRALPAIHINSIKDANIAADLADDLLRVGYSTAEVWRERAGHEQQLDLVYLVGQRPDWHIRERPSWRNPAWLTNRQPCHKCMIMETQK